MALSPGHAPSPFPPFWIFPLCFLFGESVPPSTQLPRRNSGLILHSSLPLFPSPKYSRSRKHELRLAWLDSLRTYGHTPDLVLNNYFLSGILQNPSVVVSYQSILRTVARMIF